MTESSRHRRALGRGVFTILTGAGGAQLVTLVAAPIITRLYTPAEFGIFSSILAAASVISIGVSLKFELGIPLAQANHNAQQLAKLAYTSILFFSLLLSAAVALPVFFESLNSHWLAPYKSYLWLLPVCSTVMALQQVAHYFTLRSKRHTAIALSRLLHSLVAVGIQILGYAWGATTLLCSVIIATLVSMMPLDRTTHILCRILYKGKLPLYKIINSLKRYRRFPVYSTPDAVIGAAAIVLPTLVIAGMYGPGPAGSYALTHRILVAPLGLVGSAINQVLLGEVRDLIREGKLAIAFSDVLSALLKIAIIPSCAIAIYGQELFVLAFGENWRTSGSYAQLMAPWICMQLITSPLSVIYVALGKQRSGLIFQVLNITARTTTLGFGVLSGGAEEGIRNLSLVSAALYLGLLLYINSLVENPLRSIAARFGTELLWLTGYASLAVIVKYYVDEPVAAVVSLILATVISAARVFATKLR